MLSSSTVSTETSILIGLLSSKNGQFVLESKMLNSQWGIVLPISVLFTALCTQTSHEFCGPEWTAGNSGGPRRFLAQGASGLIRCSKHHHQEKQA